MSGVLEIILTLIVVWCCVSVLIPLILGAENRSIFECIKKIYKRRNLFGIIISSIVTFLLIPGVIWYLIFLLIDCLISACKYVWKLGDKK